MSFQGLYGPCVPTYSLQTKWLDDKFSAGLRAVEDGCKVRHEQCVYSNVMIHELLAEDVYDNHLERPVSLREVSSDNRLISEEEVRIKRGASVERPSRAAMLEVLKRVSIRNRNNCVGAP